MSYLPIILIVVYLLNNKGNLKDFIGDFDFESISPLLSLFGVNENLLKTLSSLDIKNVLQGNADIKSILPLIINLASSMNNHGQQVSEVNDSFTTTPEALEPIKDLAPEQIISSLGNYFHN